MKAIRRASLLLIIGLLIAGIPLSASASEDLLKTDLDQATARFDQGLTQAIATGLDPVRADQLMWRFSQVTVPSHVPWWRRPFIQHRQLALMSQLETDLQTAYQQTTAERRDGFLRTVHRWGELMVEARNGGVSTEGLDDTRAQFSRYDDRAATPNDFAGFAQVLSRQTTLLQDRLAEYRAARSAATVVLQNVRSLLSDAAQYPQLSLDDFRTQIAAAASDLAAVHAAEGFAPIQERFQQTAVAIQALLDARGGAYSQLADTRSTLAAAQSDGAELGSHPSAIGRLAAQLESAGDRGAFQWITSQLFQHKQALADAIWQKQQAAFNPGNLGAGKVIVISLSRQVLTAYQDGNTLVSTYVTTGRPDLPTPPGVYRIMAKYSPFLFVSPWGYGSSYWYPSSWTTYAMLFRSGGYFIHDAPWRSWYGPGSNFGAGTHGCINVPYSPMSFLWRWTPIGTTVVVTW